MMPYQNLSCWYHGRRHAFVVGLEELRRPDVGRDLARSRAGGGQGDDDHADDDDHFADAADVEEVQFGNAVLESPLKRTPQDLDNESAHQAERPAA